MPARRVAVQAAADVEQQGVSTPAAEQFKPQLIDMNAKGINRRQILTASVAGAAFATCPCCPGAANAEEWDYGRWACMGLLHAKWAVAC